MTHWLSGAIAGFALGFVAFPLLFLGAPVPSDLAAVGGILLMGGALSVVLARLADLPPQRP